MKISVITLFPDMISGFFNESILKRAQEKKLVEIEVVNLRDFALDSYGTVDDRPYGGGAGMVMRADVLGAAINKVKDSSSKVILTSAKGNQFVQKKAKELSQLDHIVIIAGHYEGVDERVMEYVDEEMSIGDYVLTGGEIPAAVIIDSVVRLLPGVLKKNSATEEESFYHISVNELIDVVGETEILGRLRKSNIEFVQLLEYPQYTRPEEFEGKKAPEELLSGNHEQIRKYRLKRSYEETKTKRPDLLDINTQ
ncbi:tRNA (guanosine(37)-N1)-methyltransferase TrmD [Candidatus Roizmanbacteria bacterium CG_4_10_14_0_2_um_filter_39_13]|uniref:tRNA (guanine-N(1)-)-methyltransferase n=1 Tax=Candidatus Roizmanbacteria bacterium CG_4_10_14_0_2_um_filter_39_13 TaxID=1974825 RepID=A0A2M7U084_9BACT|nr:MAG: tRNA (guanosine(37)-N1)-methyltransferase TrmD [Candidatus Roizmanbacteria bacterium CG_4_10_14_0_2_um_filter_39_13]